MASPSPSKKGTNQFMRQGHTTNEYGNDPSIQPKGKAGNPPKDIKP